MLAVDDNKLNLVVLKGFLKKTGATIDSCGSGDEALRFTESKEYDIIFLDHMMPGMDGVETFKKIKSQNSVNSNKPILVVTANAVDGARDFYIEQGFTDYISKPIDSDYLNMCLYKYLPEDKIAVKKNEE
jgi:CheY-like chemotaxis protein